MKTDSITMAPEQYIQHLDLQPHPEGDFYKETYRSTEMITLHCLPDYFTGDRHFYTAIYYLLRQQEHFQIVIPATAWFAAEPAPGKDFALVGCTVAPGFDFADFEMGNKKTLLDQHPGLRAIIHRLSR